MKTLFTFTFLLLSLHLAAQQKMSASERARARAGSGSVKKTEPVKPPSKSAPYNPYQDTLIGQILEDLTIARANPQAAFERLGLKAGTLGFVAQKPLQLDYSLSMEAHRRALYMKERNVIGHMFQCDDGRNDYGESTAHTGIRNGKEGRNAYKEIIDGFITEFNNASGSDNYGHRMHLLGYPTHFAASHDRVGIGIVCNEFVWRDTFVQYTYYAVILTYDSKRTKTWKKAHVMRLYSEIR